MLKPDLNMPFLFLILFAKRNIINRCKQHWLRGLCEAGLQIYLDGTFYLYTISTAVDLNLKYTFNSSVNSVSPQNQRAISAVSPQGLRPPSHKAVLCLLKEENCAYS